MLESPEIDSNLGPLDGTPSTLDRLLEEHRDLVRRYLMMDEERARLRRQDSAESPPGTLARFSRIRVRSSLSAL